MGRGFNEGIIVLKHRLGRLIHQFYARIYRFRTMEVMTINSTINIPKLQFSIQYYSYAKSYSTKHFHISVFQVLYLAPRTSAYLKVRRQPRNLTFPVTLDFMQYICKGIPSLIFEVVKPCYTVSALVLENNCTQTAI